MVGRKKIRVFIIAGFIIYLVLLGGAVFFEFYSGHNIGVEFGYYGRLNRFQHAIETMPNVEIVDVFLHRDITLEGFEFNLLVNNETKFSLWISETNPIRDERNKEKIREYVLEQIAEKTKPPYKNQWRLNK